MIKIGFQPLALPIFAINSIIIVKSKIKKYKNNSSFQNKRVQSLGGHFINPQHFYGII